MAQTKTKKPAMPKSRIGGKKLAAANCPTPAAKCEPVKSVRYVGATSHLSHHHSAVAAEAGTHIWPASVIAGLAVVLTLAIAYTAVQAETDIQSKSREQQLRGDIVREIRSLNTRIDQLEQKISVPQVQPAQ